MIDLLAKSIIVLSAVYLIGIAGASFVKPALATKFLDSFASSFKAHLLEMGLRLVMGWALLSYSPNMLFGNLFELFGWVLIITSSLLLFVPWRWHHKFAEMAVRPLTQRPWIFGILCLPLGAFILYALFGG